MTEKEKHHAHALVKQTKIEDNIANIIKNLPKFLADEDDNARGLDAETITKLTKQFKNQNKKELATYSLTHDEPEIGQESILGKYCLDEILRLDGFS